MSSPISNKPLHEDSMSSPISNKPLHEDSMSSPISNKPLDEDSMSSPISNKPLDEDSMSSPISNKPLHEDSMSSSISNKPLHEDSMSSPISNKPLDEDSMSSPISNKPLHEDSMSSPISNKPLDEDSMSSPISNKPLDEDSMSSPIGNKPLDEDSMSSPIGNKPLDEDSMSSPIGNKPLDEDSMSSPIGNKPLDEDFDRRDYVDISSQIPDFLAKSSDSVREKDKLNTILKRDEKISSFHQSSHSIFKATSFSDKNFANISNNRLYSSTTPISVFSYLKHNVTTTLKGLQGLVLQNASIETTVTDEPEFLHDSDTSFTRHIPVELSSLYNSVTHFGTNITNITGRLIPQHNSTKYLERNMAKFPEEPIPQHNSTIHYFAYIPQTSKYDPTPDFSSDVAHVLRESQYNFTAHLGRYVHQQPIPQYHSTSNLDGKGISDVFETTVPHRTTITPFVADIYNDSSQLVLEFNSTGNHMENVSVLPAKPTQLPSTIRHTDGNISNFPYRTEQQNNSEKHLEETVLCVSGKSIQKENFTKRCTLNVSKSHEGSLSKYNSSSYIEVNNSSNWYEHLLKYKIKWSPLFKSSTKMSSQYMNLSFSYPVEINTTQTFDSKPGFNNSSEEDVLKLRSTMVTFENKIDSTNETRTIPDENTEKPVNHTKLGILDFNQKPISWYKDNGHRLNFSEKNKSHFSVDMFVADSQVPESSFSSVNTTTQADLITVKKPSNFVSNFENVRQSSNPSIVTTVQTTKNKQRDYTGINSAFDSQLDDSSWNGRTSTNLNFDHQEETITTINMNSVKDEKEYFLRNLPEWEKSQKQWGLSWKLHIYITGSLFGLLALYCFISFLRLGTIEKLLSRGCVISINLMVFVMGITRALYLLFNPYNTQGLYPTVLNNFVFNTGFLCVTSGFAILFLALLQTTKVVILPHCVQNSRFLSGIIILQFIFSTTTDVLQGFGLSGALLRLIYHTTQSLWGLTLGVGYLHVFRKLYKSAVRKQSDLVRTAFTRLHIDGAQLPKKLPKPTLCLAVRSTIMVVVFCLVMVALRVFGIIYIYGIFERKRPTPWIWFGYQSVSRLVELLMCFALTFIATLPMKRFELNEQRCSNFLLCSAVIGSSCSRNKEVESENFPIFLPNHQGNPNVAFHKTSLERPRRWNHTTSLPTIPTFSIELENNFHMKKVSTNTDTVEEKPNPSVPNLLSSGYSNHPSNTNDCSDVSQKPTNSEDKLLDGSSTSMLYIDQGFIRFRTAADPEQPLYLNEDELSEVLSYHDENESTKAQAGSSIQTLCEEDLFQNSLSPFFQTGFYLSRLKRLSHWSLDTTDNSVELSPEQLSNVTSKNGFSSCALDITLRKQGSTCSSESAANSFDVTFFLNREANEDKTSNVHIRDTMTRSVSPLVASTRRNHDFQLDLGLTSGSGVGQVNVACGTEDVTPDSAVYLDIQVSQENYCKKTDVLLVDNLARKSLCSQSMTDINKTWTEYSRGFFGQLKSSTFSLDTNFNGCELLETKQESQLRRTNSDKGPLLTDSRTFFPLAANLNKSPFIDSKQLHQGDSGLLKDLPEYLIQIDQACQTEPVFTEEKFTKTRGDSSKGASRWPLFSYREVIV
ncbi:uncharacterized protein LOC143247241 [Tachypleus tridentatus]|uniref:uncharacterized protein LOC143247241 n=1 Tax=Tachypleus tridentatus TaxID=6853 RepID=UPI003FD1CD52